MISAPPCPAPHLFRWKRSFSPSPEPNTQPCSRPVSLRPHTRMLRPARAASTLVRPYGLFRCDCLCSGHGRPPFSSLHIGKGPSRRISHRRTNRSREYPVALRVICSAAAHKGPVSLRCACQPRSWSPCCHLGDAPDSEADARGSALTRLHGAASLRASRSGTSRFLLSQALWSGASLPRSRKGRDRPGPAAPPAVTRLPLHVSGGRGDDSGPGSLSRGGCRGGHGGQPAVPATLHG